MEEKSDESEEARRYWSEGKGEEREEAKRYWKKVNEETGGGKGKGEVGKEKAGVDDREVRMMGDPRRPSEADGEDHARRNHCPYRYCCGICVRACGRDLDHRAHSGKERGLSEFSFDYCFLGDEFGCKLTTLVGMERKTGCCMATAVPMKGYIGRFTIDTVLEFIEEVGDGATTIVVKTDQGPSIVCLVGDLLAARDDGRTVADESAVQSSVSNGIVERSVQTIEGRMRSILVAFEGNVMRFPLRGRWCNSYLYLRPM